MERLFSGDSHLPFNLLFTGLTLLPLVYELSGSPQNPGAWK